MDLKKTLRQGISSYLKGRLVIREKEMARGVLDKKLFIESLLLLREIEDRRDFMEEELGVDMSVYEHKFLQVIENLFRIHFSKEQFALIQYYIYQVPTLSEFDGTIDITDGKEMITVNFGSPEDVWNVVEGLKKV
jgi:hypothetical protein